MIYGMLLSLCIVVGVFSRKLYWTAAEKLSDNLLALAVTLDFISSGCALLILASYWNVFPVIDWYMS